MEMVIIPNNELDQKIREALRSELNALNVDRKNPLNGTDDSQLLKRTDVAKLFNVSIATIHNWVNSGYLQFHKIGNRTFFKKDEVIEAMRTVKIRRK